MTPESDFLVKPKAKFTLTSFIHDSRSVGILLLLCTAASLIISNIDGIGSSYHEFWHIELPRLHTLHLPHNLLHIINDVLMAVFFFQVGMEIKRESVIGELSSPSRMMLPLIAAVSGVLFPALIFLLINKGSIYQNGWAIPTATDIAFSLGILSLLGKRVPHTFKIFLTALAIIDDLCAILIIAFFYGTHPHFSWLLAVVLCTTVIFLVIRYSKSKFGKTLVLFLGMALWYFMYRSGIHATFAGVILAILLPVNRIPVYERKLLFPVNFLIIPLFALANTSITINAGAISNLLSELSLGIIFGLIIGKPLGISLAVYFMSRTKLVRLRNNHNWMQFIGLGVLAGIGFTMSIFVSTLAFEENETLQDTAKLSVLIASFIAMTVGFAWLAIASRKNPLEEVEEMKENG